ncbi:MAG: hypothetical protein FD180_3017 [Planctomycetota bacterium]|nr:MAG: hypothetical protein FD180_3017 [Planctomycetota bacterium]
MTREVNVETFKTLFEKELQDVRRYKRNEVAIGAKVRILDMEKKKIDEGTVQVKNVSLKGAFLGEFKLGKNSFPAKPFLIELRMSGKTYQGINAVCKPVRFGKADDYGIGVEFEELWVETK